MNLRIIALILILTACSVAVPNTDPTQSTQAKPEPIFAAVLTDLEGNVTINGQPAHDRAELRVGDTIRTEDESEATIIFFDTSRTQVWDNTTLVVQRLQTDTPRSVQLKQTSGEIWTRLLRLSGVTDFEVITPTTVAAVRGTGFWVAVRNGTTAVGVTEGEVQLQRIEDALVTKEQVLEKEQQVIVDQKMDIEPLVHDGFIDENLQKDEEFIKAVRERVGSETFDLIMREPKKDS